MRVYRIQFTKNEYKSQVKHNLFFTFQCQMNANILFLQIHKM